MKLRVMSKFGDQMFVADVNDDWSRVLGSRKLTSPHMSDIKKVPTGTGNVGDSLEFRVTYDGSFEIEWESFKSFADEAA